ncbi:MAG: LysM domain-containing protein [Planctomycetes bacterium]|nr:LysM domain-containing protein [Planctomycetota bacterium]
MTRNQRITILILAALCIAVGIFWEKMLRVPGDLIAEGSLDEASLTGRPLPSNSVNAGGETVRGGSFDEPSLQSNQGAEVAYTETSREPQGAPTTYKIKSGDSYEKISRQIFGTASYAQRIADANPGVLANRLQIGQEINIPVIPQTPPRQTTVQANAPRTSNAGDVVYEVRRGDTLSGIAGRFYGSQAEWRRIAEANPGVNPNALPVGHEIVIPAKK